MKLYCEKCNELHEFTPRGLERLVYALQAALTCTEQEGIVSQGGEGVDCLEYLGGVWDDQETCAEYISSLVESRCNAEGVDYRQFQETAD